MGTNFYAEGEVCKHCGRGDETIHLGKSSIGWKFTLQANGFRFYKDWPEMKKWLVGKKINDEYGRKITRKEFIEWVENRQKITDPEVDFGSGAYEIDGYKFHDYEFS